MLSLGAEVAGTPQGSPGRFGWAMGMDGLMLIWDMNVDDMI
jgi:hypothetical protein